MNRAICGGKTGLVIAAVVAVGTAIAHGQTAPQAPAASAPAAPPAAPTAAPVAGRGQQPAGPDMNQFYTVGGDSLERPGVPRGMVKGPFVLPDSKAYPGTQHTYWVHVPAQYDAAVPASLMIFQDGQACRRARSKDR